MPSVHIEEQPFSVLADHLGYEGAKDRVQGLVREEATRVRREERENNE